MIFLLHLGADSDQEKSSASGTSTPIGSDYTEEKVEKPPVPQEERDRKMGEYTIARPLFIQFTYFVMI